jgi:hypothetical protein
MQVHNHNACAFVYPKRTPDAYSTNMLRAQRAGRAIFHCYPQGALLRSYEFRIGETLNEAAVGQPTRKDLEDQAKTNLINERLAFSPYAQISFKSEYLW